MSEAWAKAIEWERDWWGTCVNTLGEEIKQTLYADRMGLRFFHDGKTPYNIDMAGQSVADIGGGPCSLLLKCVSVRGTVIDPCRFSQWTCDRYAAAGIRLLQQQGEDFGETAIFCDETWIYNTLQHTIDPGKIAGIARRIGKIVRVFEWIDTVTNEGHPHAFTAEQLDAWFGGRGKVEHVNDRGCVGACWYGVFKGDSYGE